MCDSLIAATSMIFDQEQVNIILAGLSIEYESIRVVASATPMSLDLLTRMLLNCEAQQLELVSDIPMQAKLVSQQKGDGSVHSK